MGRAVRPTTEQSENPTVSSAPMFDYSVLLTCLSIWVMLSLSAHAIIFFM